MNKDKLDQDHLMALGGIIASCKGDKTNPQDLDIDKCIKYLKENKKNISGKQHSQLLDLRL